MDIFESHYFVANVTPVREKRKELSFYQIRLPKFITFLVCLYDI